MKPIIIFLLFLPGVVIAQVSITGKVVNAADKKPVPFASVFLSNTVVGGKTNDEGTFTLNNVKSGQYDLVISFIGFETRYQHVVVNDKTITLSDIAISAKTTALKEVKIGLPDANRAKYLAIFAREFLGRSENTADCKIVNLDILNINYNSAEGTLNATSDDYLVVENNALGYKIKFQINKFVKNYHSNLVYYEGPALFEEMVGKPSQQRNWVKKRLETYKASSMYFLRSIIANKVDSIGFKVLRLISPFHPSDSVLKANPTKYISLLPGTKSAGYQFLDTVKLKPNDYVRRVDAKNIYALSFPDYLYIACPKSNAVVPKNLDIYPSAYARYVVSMIKVNSKFAIFDQNGIFTDAASATFQGGWAKSGVADLLPVDYEPKP